MLCLASNVLSVLLTLVLIMVSLTEARTKMIAVLERTEMTNNLNYMNSSVTIINDAGSNRLDYEAIFRKNLVQATVCLRADDISCVPA